jgi:hypothetical protein
VLTVSLVVETTAEQRGAHSMYQAPLEDTNANNPESHYSI